MSTHGYIDGNITYCGIHQPFKDTGQTTCPDCISVMGLCQPIVHGRSPGSLTFCGLERVPSGEGVAEFKGFITCPKCIAFMADPVSTDAIARCSSTQKIPPLTMTQAQETLIRQGYVEGRAEEVALSLIREIDALRKLITVADVMRCSALTGASTIAYDALRYPKQAVPAR